MALDPINDLQQLIRDGDARAFDLAPMVLRVVLETRAWVGRNDRWGKPFESFEAFATHILWEGLETSIEDLELYCRKQPDVLQMLRAEIGALGEPGGDHGNQHTGGKRQGDNVTTVRGNNPTYALRRLKRDRPDLADKVVRGELSAHAAALEAGFCRKPTPLEEWKRIWKRASPAEREEMRVWFEEQILAPRRGDIA